VNKKNKCLLEGNKLKNEMCDKCGSLWCRACPGSEIVYKIGMLIKIDDKKDNNKAALQ
jgi:hypothetical protein